MEKFDKKRALDLMYKYYGLLQRGKIIEKNKVKRNNL